MASASHSSEMAYSPVQDTSRSKRMVCLGCSLVCDDIVARPNSDEFQTAGQLCSKGLHWLADSSAIRNHESTLLARESGIDEVLDYAAGKFAAAVRPLILLASDISNEVARAAIALADRAHAVLDIDGSASRVNFYSALQNGSVCTSTLGEASVRSDLIIFWHCDPVSTHPRLFERHLLKQRPMDETSSSAPKLIIVHSKETNTDSICDVKVTLAENTDYESLQYLRALCSEKSVATKLDTKVQAELTALAKDIVSAKHAIFFGDGKFGDSVPSLCMDAILKLVAERNDVMPCAYIGLTCGTNRSGVEDVLTWQTGYPFAVDFTQRFPRFDPLHNEATGVVRRGETDFVLIVGECGEEFRQALLTVDCPVVSLSENPIELKNRQYSWTSVPRELIGTFHRLDGLPIFAPNTSPSQKESGLAEFLERISKQVMEQRNQIGEAQSSLR